MGSAKQDLMQFGWRYSWGHMKCAQLLHFTNREIHFFAGYPIDYLLNLYLGLSSTSEAGQVMDSWCNRLATVT
jgi:hypothetical protein